MKTFVISEIGINHGGNIDMAKEMIYKSKEAGVSAVKFQTYTMQERINDKNTQYAGLFEKCMLSYEEHGILKEYADSVGIEFFSTPFGTDSLKFLVEDLGLRKIKLASFDVTNTKFLDAVNEYGKQFPVFRVILSTGMASSYEIDVAIGHFPDVAYLTLLHCVSSYPTPENEANLAAIRNLKFMVHGHRTVGYSDHTSGIIVPAGAVLVGATTIEKHFTLDLNNGSVDNPVSADPRMMAAMVELIKSYEEILGDGEIGLKEIEKATTVFRRKS